LSPKVANAANFRFIKPVKVTLFPKDEPVIEQDMKTHLPTAQSKISQVASPHNGRQVTIYSVANGG
jgi:hypothetical protein